MFCGWRCVGSGRDRRTHHRLHSRMGHLFLRVRLGAVVISPPRVRHRRREAAILAAVLTAVVTTVIAAVLGLALLLYHWIGS